MQFTHISTDETMRELAGHGTADFPFHYYYEDIRKFDHGYIERHWHREFEFMSVEYGEVSCAIGDSRITLGQGDAIFINSGVIHRFDAPSGGIIPNILFAPEFIAPDCSAIYQKYVKAFTDSDITHAALRSTVPWQCEVLKLLTAVYRLSTLRQDGWELEVQAAAGKIWSLLYKHREACASAEKSGLPLAIQSRLKLMTDFIESHYASKLTLVDIADAASISKTEALRCFQAGFLTSPVDYLIRHRLKVAYQLLSGTGKSVTEIAFLVGVENVSYFNRLFKREFGGTPGGVRKRGTRQPSD